MAGPQPAAGASSNLSDNVARAKQLASESQARESLDSQITNLHHMQAHYRLIAGAKVGIVKNGPRESVPVAAPMQKWSDRVIRCLAAQVGGTTAGCCR